MLDSVQSREKRERGERLKLSHESVLARLLISAFQNNEKITARHHHIENLEWLSVPPQRPNDEERAKVYVQTASSLDSICSSEQELDDNSHEEATGRQDEPL